MTSIPADEITKPVESINPDNLPEVKSNHAEDALDHLVQCSSTHHDLSHSIHANAHSEFVLRVFNSIPTMTTGRHHSSTTAKEIGPWTGTPSK